MKLENGILFLDSSFDNQQLQEILPSIIEQIDEIFEVTIDSKSLVASSGLFTLIKSLKKTKSDLKVSLFEINTDILGLGNVTFISKKVS